MIVSAGSSARKLVVSFAAPPCPPVMESAGIRTDCRLCDDRCVPHVEEPDRLDLFAEELDAHGIAV